VLGVASPKTRQPGARLAPEARHTTLQSNMMMPGKRLLLFSPNDPAATALNAPVADWGCLVTICQSVDELRSRIEGADHDAVLLEGSSTLRQLVGEADPNGEILRTPLAEIEKRHILRVLTSTNGNKTRAARILGIDTKTLYNKLKSYGAAAAAFRRKPNTLSMPDSSRIQASS
jgi:DNA-binding protein Fis